jgi:hypothetical protein
VIKNPSAEMIESYFYRRFSIKVTKLQAFVTARGDDWKRQLADESLPLIADQQSVSLLLSARVENSLRLPTIRLTGDVPSLSVRMSDRELTSLLRVMDELTEAPPRNAPFRLPLQAKKPTNELVVEVAVRGADVQFELAEQSRELISAAATDVDFRFQLWEHYTSLRVSAGSVRATDKLQPTESPFARLLSTGPPQQQPNDPAFRMQYRGVSRASPRFVGVDHDISVTVPVAAKAHVNPEVLFAVADLMLAAVDSTDERKCVFLLSLCLLLLRTSFSEHAISLVIHLSQQQQ